MPDQPYQPETIPPQQGETSPGDQTAFQGQYNPYNATSPPTIPDEPVLETPPSYSNVVVSEGGSGGGIPRWFYIVLVVTLIAFFVVTGLLATTLLKSKSTPAEPTVVPTSSQTKVSPTMIVPTILPSPTPDPVITKLQQVSTSDEFADIEADITNSDLSSITSSLAIFDQEMKTK